MYYLLFIQCSCHQFVEQNEKATDFCSLILMYSFMSYSLRPRVGTSLLRFYFYPLCYAAVLLKFTYYAQHYAQVQELWSEYYAIYIQVFMNKLILVIGNFRETVLLECIRV